MGNCLQNNTNPTPDVSSPSVPDHSNNNHHSHQTSKISTEYMSNKPNQSIVDNVSITNNKTDQQNKDNTNDLTIFTNLDGNECSRNNHSKEDYNLSLIHI